MDIIRIFVTGGTFDGVYVAMNGRALPWDKVHKNRKTGVFEEIEP